MVSSTDDIAAQLHGAWELLEWSEEKADGTKAYPLGEDAAGQIAYTPDGHVAAQLVRTNRAGFASTDWREASSDEAARAFKEYFGYFGTFSVDTKRSVVVHHVQGSWFPNLEGRDQERHYSLDGDLLVLHADTDWGHVKIVWRRCRPARR